MVKTKIPNSASGMISSKSSKMVVLENAGHDIAVEQPDKLSKIILNFIQ